MKLLQKIYLYVILLCTFQYSYAQTTSPVPLETDWNRIYIKDIGFFDLPPTMEVQKGKYKKYLDEVKKINGYEVSKLTAQQKGINELNKESFEKYARVMIQTDYGNIGDYEKLNFSITQFSQTDINLLNNTYKQQFQKSTYNTSLKLLEWHPLKIEKINGMSCIHVSYKRQIQDNPPVLVNMYYFHNNDRMYLFTLSYRLSESEYWKSDYTKILESFRITNIK